MLLHAAVLAGKTPTIRKRITMIADYKVADISLADWGRKEIAIA